MAPKASGIQHGVHCWPQNTVSSQCGSRYQEVESGICDLPALSNEGDNRISEMVRVGKKAGTKGPTDVRNGVSAVTDKQFKKCGQGREHTEGHHGVSVQY